MSLPTAAKHVGRILAFSIAHLVAVMMIAVVAFGADMDQLRSRSAASRAAAVVHDFLWLPHDSTLRLIPNAWLVRNTFVIPLAIAVNSLAWGTLLYVIWRLVRRLRSRGGFSPLT